MKSHEPRRFTRSLSAAVGMAVAAATLAVAPPSAHATAKAAKAPKPGGEVRFGLEAESTGGFCLSQAQLAISGIQVAAAIYDTLTVPNAKGRYVPYLAESVTPNTDYTEWTIKLRPGVTFHDGEPLDANAVKLNLDSYRGQNPNLPARLFVFVLSNIASVDVVDPLTVKVTMKAPWPAFPAYLYSTGRLGIMAPAQINDPDTCATNLIGTGPFELDEWRQNERLVVSRNPRYWAKDPKGNQLPYLDKITFVPVPDGPQRVSQLEGGQLDLLHTSSAMLIDELRAAGRFTMMVDRSGTRDVRYYLLNSEKPPLNDPDARLALALALDRKKINQIRNKGLFEVANSVFDKNAAGYLKNNGYPKYDPKKARQLVDQVKAANGGQFNVTFLTTNDSENLQEAQLLAEEVEKVGIHADIAQFDQSALINQALAGNFSILLWRNLHSDPQWQDSANYVWWYTNSPVNFGRFKDPVFQQALDQGRVATDAESQQVAYEALNKRFVEQQYLIPAWYVDWTIAANKSVKGLKGVPLPDGSMPRFFYGRIPVTGLYKT